MSIANIFILLGTGIVAGFAGGMLGLGGAFIMTPFQYMVYINMGVAPDVAIKTAFGTSLLVVLTTAVSGAWRHHRERGVNWRLAMIMGGCGFVFGGIGATLTNYIPGDVLKIAFGAIAIISCVRMFFTAREKEAEASEKGPWVWALWGIPVGLFSGILGVGGGVIMMPILVIAMKCKIKEAVGNSLAVMIFTSVGGIIGYLVNGIHAADTVAYSVGYINFTAWALLAVPAAIMAQLGAMIAHRIPQKLLTYIFVILLLYIGLRMIGVFEWLGWPL
jgi:uncharacterized membrane protein YfcA